MVNLGYVLKAELSACGIRENEKVIEESLTWSQGYAKFEMFLDTKEKMLSKKGCLVCK